MTDARGQLHLEMVGIDELADAAHHLNLACLGHAREAGGEFADHFLFPATQFVEINLRLAKADAVFGQCGGFIGHRRDMQQCLGGNAADVQTNPAEFRVTLNKNDFHAQIGGAECRRVAAGARTQHHHFTGDVGSAVVGFDCRCGHCCCRRGDSCLDRFQHQHQCPLRNFIADFYLDLLDHTGFWRGHLHGGLVTFQ